MPTVCTLLARVRHNSMPGVPLRGDVYCLQLCKSGLVPSLCSPARLTGKLFGHSSVMSLSAFGGTLVSHRWLALDVDVVCCAAFQAQLVHVHTASVAAALLRPYPKPLPCRSGIIEPPYRAPFLLQHKLASS